MNMQTESVYLRTIFDDSYCKPAHIGNLDACKEQGEAASDQCFKRNENPYPDYTAENRWWDYGWTNSLVELSGGRK